MNRIKRMSAVLPEAPALNNIKRIELIGFGYALTNYFALLN